MYAHYTPKTKHTGSLSIHKPQDPARPLAAQLAPTKKKLPRGRWTESWNFSEPTSFWSCTNGHTFSATCSCRRCAPIRAMGLRSLQERAGAHRHVAGQVFVVVLPRQARSHTSAKRRAARVLKPSLAYQQCEIRKHANIVNAISEACTFLTKPLGDGKEC